MTEKSLQQRIMRFCKAEGILAYKFASPGHAGVPDLILMANGRVIFFELKHPNGKGVLSALQKATIERMLAAKIEVYVGHEYETICEIIRSRLIPGATGSRDEAV